MDVYWLYQHLRGPNYTNIVSLSQLYVLTSACLFLLKEGARPLSSIG